MDTNGLELKRSEKQLPYSVWPHAYGQNEVGGGEAGGTLAVAISRDHTSEVGFAISGGGGGSCCFHLFNCEGLRCKGCSSSTIDSTFSITLHTIGVSAVAAKSDIAVSGGKDGVCVFVFCL